MEQSFDYDSEVLDALFGYLDSPPYLSPSSDSTILAFPPPPPCDISSSSLHASPKSHQSISDLYNHELPQPHFEQTSFIYPFFDPTLFAEFEAPQPVVVATVATGVTGLSAQGMAARERRKRISEKTLELGRLIPGGNRMSTAEMLQAGFKYVKFLQAQLGVLQLMASIPVPVCKNVQDEHLHVLLGSTVVHEKLSATGMCIAPKEIVDKFVADPQLKSTLLIS